MTNFTFQRNHKHLKVKYITDSDWTVPLQIMLGQCANTILEPTILCGFCYIRHNILPEMVWYPDIVSELSYGISDFWTLFSWIRRCELFSHINTHFCINFQILSLGQQVVSIKLCIEALHVQLDVISSLPTVQWMHHMSNTLLFCHS